MSVSQISEQLIALRLQGMDKAMYRVLETPDMADWSFEDKFGFLVNAQTHDRAQKKQIRMLKAAKLKHSNACMEDIDYRAKRGLERSYIETLKTCDWIMRNQFLVITGSTGVGKTWLGCAFANQAVRLGYSVLYKRFSLLLEELEIAHRDGSLPKLRNKLAKVKLLILDDWAMSPLSAGSRLDLLEVIEDRSGDSALLITSQLPISKWHEYIAEPTMADAIMDRIIHRAHKLELSGQSMRRKYGVKKGGKDHDSL